MDKELLTTLGLDPEKDLKGLLEDLESKQYEFFERLETTNDEKRREELNELLSHIDAAINQIKEQLASVNSAIILDEGEPQPEAATEETVPEQPEQAEKTQKKEKEAKLESKVQELKQKIEARLQQEPSESPAEEAVQQKNANPVDTKLNAELQQGLQCYKRKDFPAALQIFKQLAEKNVPVAQYMLACMYSRAEGTSADHGRTEFWMKRAADNGDPSAQFDYAVLLLSRRGGNPKEVTKQAMDYLRRSADQGNRDAMEKFVDLVDKGDGGIAELKAARIYCDNLLPLMDDSYDRQRFSDLRRTLRERQIKLQAAHCGDIVATVASIVGGVMLIVVTVLAFAGYHQDGLMKLTWAQQLPVWVKAVAFGAWHELPSITSPAYFDLGNMPTIVLLVAVGWILKCIGRTYTRNVVAQVVVHIASAMRYVALLAHFVLCSFIENSILKTPMGWQYYLPIENIVAFVVMALAGYTIGLVLNLIVRKVLTVALKVKL